MDLSQPEAPEPQTTHALDVAFRRAADDDAVKVIVLKAVGKHFSAGHDIGAPGRDHKTSFERKAMAAANKSSAGEG